MGRWIDADSLISSLGHCECDGHKVHKLSQRRLTADWLASREGDCSRMYSKVSSDWLPSYIKATLPVLEIFRMAGYFPDISRNKILSRLATIHLLILICHGTTGWTLLKFNYGKSPSRFGKLLIRNIRSKLILHDTPDIAFTCMWQIALLKACTQFLIYWRH